MKKFKIPCDFDGTKAAFDLYIGSPADDLHPLQFQKRWLWTERGGKIPDEVLDSFRKLQNIAKENNESFEELCMYALGNKQDKVSDELREKIEQANKKE